MAATAPRQPQDRQKKKGTRKPNAKYSFTGLDGKTYTLEKPTNDVLTGSFYRRIRKGNALDQLCDMVEALTTDEKTLAAFDRILDDDDATAAFENQFEAHCKDVQGATPGE